MLDLKDHKITAIPKEVLGAFAHVTAAGLVQRQPGCRKRFGQQKRRGNTSIFIVYSTTKTYGTIIKHILYRIDHIRPYNTHRWFVLFEEFKGLLHFQTFSLCIFFRMHMLDTTSRWIRHQGPGLAKECLGGRVLLLLTFLFFCKRFRNKVSKGKEVWWTYIFVAELFLDVFENLRNYCLRSTKWFPWRTPFNFMGLMFQLHEFDVSKGSPVGPESTSGSARTSKGILEKPCLLKGFFGERSLQGILLPQVVLVLFNEVCALPNLKSLSVSQNLLKRLPKAGRSCIFFCNSMFEVIFLLMFGLSICCQQRKAFPSFCQALGSMKSLKNLNLGSKLRALPFIM